MYRVVLLIGGNLGERAQLIQEVHKELTAVGSVILSSRLYETEAWGETSEGNYLNQALVVETSTSPDAFIRHTQGIEKQLGRTREIRWGNRTMDIDLIYIDDLIYQGEHLTVPHPLMAQRNFVLVPLAEILPDFIHPILKVSNKELLRRCTDTSKVKLYLTHDSPTSLL